MIRNKYQDPQSNESNLDPYTQLCVHHNILDKMTARGRVVERTLSSPVYMNRMMGATASGMKLAGMSMFPSEHIQ